MSEIQTTADRKHAPALAAGLICVAALLSTAPGPLSAQADPAVGPQPGSFGFHAGAGVALPAGDLTAAVEPGASLAGGVSHFLDRHLGLWGSVDLQFLSGATDDAGNAFPDMRMLHAGVGGELNLFGGYDLRDDPDPTPVTATFRLGLGLSSLDTEDSLDGGGPAPFEFDHTYLSFQGGATAGYQVTPRVNVFVGSTAYLIVTDREDTRVFADHSPEVELFDVAWSVPVRAGLRITLR